MRVRPGGKQRLLEIVRGAGLRMVGPHSWGVLNTAEQVSLNTMFTSASVRAGGLAIGSQSGGLGLLGQAAARQLGVSIFVWVGDRRRRVDQRPARVVRGGRADGRGDAVRGDVRQSRAFHPDRPSAVHQRQAPEDPSPRAAKKSQWKFLKEYRGLRRFSPSRKVVQYQRLKTRGEGGIPTEQLSLCFE